MRLLYSIGIYILSFSIKLLALFNSKLKLGVDGRKKTFEKLKTSIKHTDKTFWFHCASLGEYEQGLPVFEALIEKYPTHKVVLSFFSPSGYEIRKNSKIADIVVYLPLDTKANASRFLDIVNPDYTLFVKYEIWPNYLLELKKRKLNVILISAVFRKSQRFFKWYGGLMRTSLTAFNHIFVQNEDSKILLNSIGYTEVTVSGDTRFDRVLNQLQVDNSVSFIDNFKNNTLCMVFGSTWPQDDKLYLEYINANNTTKFIIAPHHIKSGYINSLKTQLKVKTICFSDMNDEDLSRYNVFILDTIGYLSKVYHYADIVYVGGAAGNTGLHNILEPAVFGKPIIIGKNYEKFPEAKTLISNNGVISVKTSHAFKSITNTLISNESMRKKQGHINKNYIYNNCGAVSKIMEYINV